MIDKSPNRFRRFTFRLIRLVLLAYAAIIVMMVVMESRLVYPGAYFGRNSHADLDAGIQTVEIASLPCRLCEREDPSRCVLFLHGNGVRAAELDRWTRRLSDALDANVLTAEYRGFEDDQCSGGRCRNLHPCVEKSRVRRGWRDDLLEGLDQESDFQLGQSRLQRICGSDPGVRNLPGDLQSIRGTPSRIPRRSTFPCPGGIRWDERYR